MSSSEFYAPAHSPPAPKPGKRVQESIDFAATVIELAIEDGCDKLIHTDPDEPCAAHYPTSAADNKAAREEFAAMMSPLTPEDYFIAKYGDRLGKEVQARGQRLYAALKGGARSIAHRTPLTGGGCPIGENNLQPVSPGCNEYEKALSEVQGTIGLYHRKVHRI